MEVICSPQIHNVLDERLGGSIEIIFKNISNEVPKGATGFSSWINNIRSNTGVKCIMSTHH